MTPVRPRRNKTLSQRELRRDRGVVEPEVAAEPEEHRPRTRADCEAGPRPCPFVSCRYHLYLDVTRTGSLTLNFPDREVWELEESCSLDVAARGGAPLEEVGRMLNVTRTRADQIEQEARAHVARTWKD